MDICHLVYFKIRFEYKYHIDKSYNLSTNKLGEFHLNKYWILEIILNIKPEKIYKNQT